jgi:uncharacterized protein with GYD domain
MATYVMLSNLTDEGAKTLKENPGRLQEVNKEIEKLGAKVTAQYATLGLYDFVNIVEAPDNATIARLRDVGGTRQRPSPDAARDPRSGVPEELEVG